jgi:heme oxygenase
MATEASESHVARGRILARLKQETVREHEAIEAAAVATGFLVDAGAYRRYLRAMYGFFAAIEPELERALPELAGRAKLDWLRADLVALGEVPDAVRVCPHIRPFTDRSRAFGAGYVVEGSMLGGRYILDRLRRAGVAPEARTFFTGYGPDTGARWRSFVAMLGAFAGEDGCSDAIVEGANATFLTLRGWLSRLPAA